jgi:hypothetical protein
MTKNILLLATGLALGGLRAYAQEYTSVDSSETIHSTNAAGDDITTYTSYKTSHNHGQTKVDAYIRVDTEYAPVCDSLFWTWSKRAPTSVSFSRIGDWKVDALAARHISSQTPLVSPQAPAVPRIETSVTVIDGALTPEQIRRLVNGQ